MGKKIDLTGQTFYYLTVLNEVPYEQRKNKKQVEWHCKCKCGKEVNVITNYLKSGHTKSCGCLRGENAKKLFSKNIAGEKFYKLTALEPTEERGSDGSIIWKCQCDCGNIHYVSTNSLKTGAISSCGCLRSKGEMLITQILQLNNVNFKKQYSFEDLKDKNKLFFDFAIFDKNNNLICLIEYQGEQHYKDTTRGSWKNLPFQHDAMKKEYCKKNSIKLIEIPYTDFNKLSWNYLESKIML